MKKYLIVIVTMLLLFPGCKKDSVPKEAPSIIKVEKCPYRKVDLGLSVMWANCNVGADSPYDFGDTYSWGETTAPIGYDSKAHKWNKYFKDMVFHTADYKTALEECDDVAFIKGGDKWRMPSRSEMEELMATRNNPDYKWLQVNGEHTPYSGWSVTYLVNKKSIFLPTGWIGDDPFLYLMGYYWTATGNATEMDYAWNFDFDNIFASMHINHRSMKMAIRPVYGDRVKVNGISLDKTDVTLAENSTLERPSDVLLSATIVPRNAFEAGVAWSSSNPDVAWVFDGHVVAASKGTTKITATSIDGGFSATCEVRVQ